MNDGLIGETVGSTLKQIGNLNNVNPNASHDQQKKQQQEMGSRANLAKWTCKIEPNVNFKSDSNQSNSKTSTKTHGFTLGADNLGDLTIAVYRARTDSVWANSTQAIRDKVGVGSYDDQIFSSYVFFTVAGSTYCPHAEEEKTKFYNTGTVINNGTAWLFKPEITIDTYEQSAVMPDKRAIFKLTLMNNAPTQTGFAAYGNQFELSLIADSNPNGARVSMDGQNLLKSIGFRLEPGVPVTKTMEVERGTVDDYENLQLYFALADCPYTYAMLNFSVHFLPVSSPVEITSPRQNWTMNTLSPHDSIGYYLPIEIDGFDIHHKNFDHIEFQYKLSTESDDDWVNQCSFYANDSLYQLASGNKAMIENGRIVPFRFYGERDPKELNYDLRAVTFCRFGSGFVTKASPVISGVKDTRPPVVFGDPEPANNILGIGDHLKLRFSEPIAGNWLDEDNNFQLIGITNETSPTTDASPHFDGSNNSYTASAVSRCMDGRSFTIEMMVKPSNPNAAATFFTHGLNGNGLSFGMTADNRLILQTESKTIYSKPLPDRMLAFTRVAVTYNHKTNDIRFYAGTLSVTDSTNMQAAINYRLSAPLVFGRGLEGNILEARIWSKALTQEEITSTNKRYLTGYERELVAYYRMNEGTGTALRDRTSGATLTMHKASWNLPNGISLALTNNDSVLLDANVLSRSAVYDGTYMLWFRPTSKNGTIFRAGDKRFVLENGKLVFESDKVTKYNVQSDCTTGSWHHLVWVINRTYNNVAVYLDDQLTVTFAANHLTGVAGDMYFGGNGFEGNIDEYIVFEQALPKTFITEFGNRSPLGDEMGLIAYLPFEQQVQNPNGVLEQVFSTNNQRIFFDGNGNVIDKEQPLIIDQQSPITYLADKVNFAPVSGIGLLSKLKFNWTYNNEELLINLNMADYEINHQPVFVTVRDVEDLNGNPMPSPVMWMATVDRNALKWFDNELSFESYNIGELLPPYYYDVEFAFFNQTGNRHQFVIESVPDWLKVNESYGTIGALSDKTIHFTFNPDMPVGTHVDYIYLTDENGLSEPLRVEYIVEAVFPYEEVDKSKFALNMSVCADVLLSTEEESKIYDVDVNDKVVALYHNNCVGTANVAFDPIANKSEVFLTIHGNEAMVGREVNFQLWQASTGRMLALTPNRKILFGHGDVYGCGDETPLVLSLSGAETQNIILDKGWNWISTNLSISSPISDLLSLQPWHEGDIIKNPASQAFSSYSETADEFKGTLKAWDYTQMYMLYTNTENNILRLNGKQLSAEQMEVTLRGDGGWSSLPCLLAQTTPLTEAMADYYEKASTGDIIKAHDRFAYFSQDRKWVGDLTSLRPGEGYLFRRMGHDTVTVRFYDRPAASAPQKAPAFQGSGATTMTMIAKVQSDDIQSTMVMAYMGDAIEKVDT